MLFYTSSITPRLTYTLNFIESIINKKIEITTDKEQFLQSQGVKINYSELRICEKEYHIKPHQLLFQNTIKAVDITIDKCRNNTCFFTHENDSHAFDVFAAIFYLLSRYEEYLPHEKDMYGRYAHINSLAYKYGFLKLPLVNLWVKDLQQQLSIYYSSFTIHHSPFTFVPTYDIDIAYAYKNQPLLKNIGGFFKDMLRGDIEKITERANVYSGKQKDPFDTFDWLDQLHENYHLNPIYFFLLAKKRGIYDKNTPPSSKGMQRLIKQHAGKYKVGIHPSWQSGDDGTLVNKEIASFEKMAQQKCILSRQHYVRFTLPETYRRAAAMGIKEEYSMGYGSINGFRASVASPFYWYDLEKEQQTELLVHPFCYMEANSFFEQQYSVEEAAEEIQYYHDIVKTVGGQFITLFHNHFLTEQPEWTQWRKMYEDFLQKNFS